MEVGDDARRDAEEQRGGRIAGDRETRRGAAALYEGKRVCRSERVAADPAGALATAWENVAYADSARSWSRLTQGDGRNPGAGGLPCTFGSGAARCRRLASSVARSRSDSTGAATAAKSRLREGQRVPRRGTEHDGERDQRRDERGQCVGAGRSRQRCRPADHLGHRRCTERLAASAARDTSLSVVKPSAVARLRVSTCEGRYGWSAPRTGLP